MPRHQLTTEETMRGLTKALENPKTPKHLKPSMQARLDRLRAGKTERGSR